MREVKKDVKDIKEIASSVKELASSVKILADNIGKVEKKVDDITQEPADKWKKMSWVVLTLLVSTFLGVVLAILGLN